ncbi:MAG: signal peptidase II [Anaerolineaceae bacterium 4572_5.1]|nr:MAG: signal peptidase II [Anaerolinea sp. 4484_236]OQY30989.1 MAG: signal peptidase II [Anaerolineaceae bacterium 4572_5.1]
MEVYLKKYLRAYAFLLPLASLIVILDQWTKSIIRLKLPYNQAWMPLEWLRPYARIVHWQNTGAAFGIAQGKGLFFTILGIIVIGVIIWYFPQIPAKDFFLRLALGLQLGGAMGNLVDRLLRGYVTDFISVGSFAVFNVADSCITVGAGVLLLGMFLEERKARKIVAQDAKETQNE